MNSPTSWTCAAAGALVGELGDGLLVRLVLLGPGGVQARLAGGLECGGDEPVPGAEAEADAGLEDGVLGVPVRCGRAVPPLGDGGAGAQPLPPGAGQLGQHRQPHPQVGAALGVVGGQHRAGGGVVALDTGAVGVELLRGGRRVPGVAAHLAQRQQRPVAVEGGVLDGFGVQGGGDLREPYEEVVGVRAGHARAVRGPAQRQVAQQAERPGEPPARGLGGPGGGPGEHHGVEVRRRGAGAHIRAVDRNAHQ